MVVVEEKDEIGDWEAGRGVVTDRREAGREVVTDCRKAGGRVRDDIQS